MKITLELVVLVEEQGVVPLDTAVQIQLFLIVEQ